MPHPDSGLWGVDPALGWLRTPIVTQAANSGARQPKLASQARAELDAATPLLIAAIRHGLGQSAKIESVQWSC